MMIKNGHTTEPDTSSDKLPDPPERTAFRLGKDGEYHHTVTRADLCISPIFPQKSQKPQK